LAAGSLCTIARFESVSDNALAVFGEDRIASEAFFNALDHVFDSVRLTRLGHSSGMRAGRSCCELTGTIVNDPRQSAHE